jgi:hypothetical protein
MRAYLLGLALAPQSRIRGLAAALILIIGCLAASFQAAAQTPHFDPIEWSDRSVGTKAVGMSADGSIVVGDTGGSEPQQGFKWTVGGPAVDPCAGADPLIVPAGAICRMTGVASGVTQYVGYIGYGIVDWEGGLGPYRPACPPGILQCRSGPMASEGDVYAVRERDGVAWLNRPLLGSSNYQGPFVSPGATQSWIGGLSSDASVVVGTEVYGCGDCRHAFYAYNGTVCDLDPTGAIDFFGANGVNPAGTVAVGTVVNGVLAGPVLWDALSRDHCAAIMHKLFLPGTVFAGGEADAISQNGVVVGSAAIPGRNGEVAFRWTCNNGMESIEDLLVASGAGFRDLRALTSAIAVSSDGTVIVGNGSDDSFGVPRAWRAVLPLPGTPTLQVTPADNMAFSGPKGGSFSPSSAPYQLNRSSGVNAYAITGLPSWLSVDFATGSMTDTGTAVTFSVNASANNLAPGTYTATITMSFTNGDAVDPANPPLCTLGTQTRTVTLVVGTATHDFNGDGMSDILWHHSNGSMSTWQMNANGTHTAFNFGAVNTAWQIAGTTSLVASTGDVDGGGKADIFWRHTNGSLSLWEMGGGASHTAINLGTVATAWQIAGVGDFDGDGHADILWRHTNGSVSIWKMAANGTHTALNFGVVATAWQVAGIGDVNHDGKADIIWRHTNGTVLIWQMNGGTSHTVLNLGTVVTAWQIVGVGDVDGDGNADIFWRHSNGSLSIWKMAANGTHTVLNPGVVATAWQVVSIGDYNGDGRADILWRHTNGTVLIWKMNANGTYTPLNLGAVATAWTIVE